MPEPIAAQPASPPAAAPVVLLVEDNPADVRMIREALAVTRLAHELYVVEDGAEAIAFATRKGAYADAPQPDLVLLDLNIPKLHGHEVIARLRAERSLGRLPIVVMTGSRLEKDIDRSFALHADEHIIKPTRLFEYVGELAFALGLARRRTA
jgi:two-component system, chemotaxis family, response regulator Rcp1